MESWVSNLVQSVSSFPGFATPDPRMVEFGEERANRNLLSLQSNPVFSQGKNIQPTITNQAKVGRSSDCKSRINERRVFNSIAIISCCAKLHPVDGEGSVVFEEGRFLRVQKVEIGF